MANDNYGQQMTIDDLISQLTEIKFECGGDKLVLTTGLLPLQRIGMILVEKDDNGGFSIRNPSNKNKLEYTEKVLYIGRG